MFPSLHLSVKDIEGDGKVIFINTSNCWSTLCQKNKVQRKDYFLPTLIIHNLSWHINFPVDNLLTICKLRYSLRPMKLTITPFGSIYNCPTLWPSFKIFPWASIFHWIRNKNCTELNWKVSLKLEDMHNELNEA